MDWEFIENECLLDKDNYYIINIINYTVNVQDYIPTELNLLKKSIIDSTKHESSPTITAKDNLNFMGSCEFNSLYDFIFTNENVTLFMKKLYKSYKNLKQINKQFKLDYPRIICHVNNIRIKNSYRFLTEFKNTQLLLHSKLLCTQSTFFPIFSVLYDKYTQPFNGIHLSDYRDNNYIIINFKIYSEKEMYVTLKKNFRVIKLVDGNINILKIIRIKIIIMIGKKNYISHYVHECCEF